MKSIFGSGSGGKGDDCRPMEFMAARAWFPLMKSQLPTVESQGNGSILLLQLPKQKEKGAPGENAKCEEVGERHAGIKSGTEEARKRNRLEGRPLQTQGTTERRREKTKKPAKRSGHKKRGRNRLAAFAPSN